MGKWLGPVLLALTALAGILWFFGPYEPADLSAGFDPRKFGEGVQVYFESIESRFDDITPGVEKRVIWQPGAKEQRTPYSVVYLHGFSATSEEIRPVPDRIAGALGANLVYTRLRGHGRSGDAMAQATVADWMADTAEALAAGRAVGDKVVVIATSTGGTLAAAAVLDADLSRNVAAMILVSPNFGINHPLARLLTWPAARYWLPLLAGRKYGDDPTDDTRARFWTTRYPSVAVLPMAALVKAVTAQDFSAVRVPALFWFSDDDMVVRPDITRDIAAHWGGPATLHEVIAGPGTDGHAHVVAGDLLSPGQTDRAVSGMLAWLHGQRID